MAIYCDIYQWENEQGETLGQIGGIQYEGQVPDGARHGRIRMKPRGFWGWLIGDYTYDFSKAIEWIEANQPTTAAVKEKK